MGDFRAFLDSYEGKRARLNVQRKRSVFIHVADVEPQSKKMPEDDRLKFQRSVAEHMVDFHRYPFSGPIALSLSFTTTGKNPPQAHTVAKNYLDLLGERMQQVDFPRKHLLYKDDSQIHVLAVQGQNLPAQPLINNDDDPRERPSTFIDAKPLSVLLEKLDLAADWIRLEEQRTENSYDVEEGRHVEHYADITNDECQWRAVFGDQYDAYVKITRICAQRALLKRSGVSITTLNCLYRNRVDKKFGLKLFDPTPHLIASFLRLHMGELPTGHGQSALFKERISDAIAEFKDRWDWIINPLVVPVALEVIVRPNPNTPVAVLHDLDNIVRDYLLPKIVPAFSPTRDYRSTDDFAELLVSHPETMKNWDVRPPGPACTNIGVTRYEAWRLPAVEGEPGFVSVALVGDDIHNSLLDRVESAAKKAMKPKEPNDRWRWWHSL